MVRRVLWKWQLKVAGYLSSQSITGKTKMVVSHHLELMKSYQGKKQSNSFALELFFYCEAGRFSAYFEYFWLWQEYFSLISVVQWNWSFLQPSEGCKYCLLYVSVEKYHWNGLLEFVNLAVNVCLNMIGCFEIVPLSLAPTVIYVRSTWVLSFFFFFFSDLSRRLCLAHSFCFVSTC